MESFVFRKRLNLIVLVGSAICSKFQPSLACTSFCSSYTPGEKCIVRYFFNQICKKKKAFWSARFSYEQPSRGHSLEVCVQVQDFQKRFGFHLRFLQRFRKNINFHPFSSQLGTFTSYARNNLCDKSTVSVSFGFGEVNVLDVPNLMMSVFWVCDSLGNFTSETSH